jgi:hypothetical protein
MEVSKGGVAEGVWVGGVIALITSLHWRPRILYLEP